MLNDKKIKELMPRVLAYLSQGPKGYTEIAAALSLDKLNDIRQIEEKYTTMGLVQSAPPSRDLGHTIMLTAKGKAVMGM
jgi:hypothetical protein